MATHKLKKKNLDELEDQNTQLGQIIISQREQMSIILESITDGFFTLNGRWEFTYVNKEFERTTFLKRKELLGRNFFDVFPGAEELEFGKQYQRVMKEKVSVHFQAHYKPLNIWLSVYAYPAIDGITVYFNNITAQKEIQEKLSTDEANLRAIINNTKDIIWSMDRDMNIISANNAFWEYIFNLTGKYKDDLVLTDFDSVLSEEWIGYFRRALRGEAYNLVIESEENGVKTYNDVSFNPIYEKENEIVGVSCFSRDITQQKEYQFQIEAQNEQLRQIAWIQSHKVRGPVATILGLSQLFDETEPGCKENKVLLENLKVAAAGLDNIIREIVGKANS